MIGIFYYFNHTVHAHTVPLDEAEDYGDCKTTAFSHAEFWENALKKSLPWDYDYFPRGRVIYEKKAGRYAVYIDGCLARPKIVREIRLAFGLADTLKCFVGFDEHYQCHRCNKDYVV